MQRATRVNLLLLGVAALLGLAVYWQIGNETADFEPPLSDLDPARVQHVMVGCHGCTVRRFERRDGHWWMLEPYALPADDAMVERLIGIAVSPVRSRRLLQDFDAGKIGLDPPLMQLALDDLHFDVGLTDALRGDRYIRTGDVVAMLPDRFSPFLMATAESELDRRLVPRGSFVESVSIDGVEVPALADAWSMASATRIRVVDAIPTHTRSTRIELRLGDGSVLEYLVDRSSNPPIAWRVHDSASTQSGLPLTDSPDTSKASAVLGWELDASLMPNLLGNDGEPSS